MSSPEVSGQVTTSGSIDADVDNSGSSRAWVVANIVLIAIAIAASVVFARQSLTHFEGLGGGYTAFTDAVTYLAAGERLNAGHELYRLQAGDRPVQGLDLYFGGGNPLLSPPPIAVFWRPLAAIPWGIALWVAACWVSLLGTVLYLCIRVGLPAILLSIALSPAIGEQLAVANAYAFAPALYVLLWNYRDRPVSGAIIAVLTSVKLTPAAFMAWQIGTGQFRSLLVTIATGLTILTVSAVVVGVPSYLTWFGTLSNNNPAPYSLSNVLQVSWASYAFFFVASLLALVTGRRWPSASFELALLASVLGTPALWLSGLVPLLALSAPFIGNEGARSHALRAARAQAAAPIPESPS